MGRTWKAGWWKNCVKRWGLRKSGRIRRRPFQISNFIEGTLKAALAFAEGMPQVPWHFMDWCKRVGSIESSGRAYWNSTSLQKRKGWFDGSNKSIKTSHPGSKRLEWRLWQQVYCTPANLCNSRGCSIIRWMTMANSWNPNNQLDSSSPKQYQAAEYGQSLLRFGKRTGHGSQESESSELGIQYRSHQEVWCKWQKGRMAPWLVQCNCKNLLKRKWYGRSGNSTLQVVVSYAARGSSTSKIPY